MTGRTWTGSELIPLPFRIRPTADDGRDKFVERLAEANRIKADYLRKVLREPPDQRGLVQWERLAAVTGRDPSELSDFLGHSRCRGCGIILPLHNKVSVRRTCSAACRTKTHRQRLLSPDDGDPQTHCVFDCARWGRNVVVPAQEHRRRYCSRTCREQAREQRQGELGGLPDGEDQGGYPPHRDRQRCGLTPSRVGEVIAGQCQLQHMDVIERIADGLRIPGQMLGLARRAWETPQALVVVEREAPQVPEPEQQTPPSLPGPDVDSILALATRTSLSRSGAGVYGAGV
ncbi:hypothetical protein GCM10018966_062160 [Streptomyces yanii]